MTVNAEVIEYCERFKMCNGCKFNGGDCVAPLANYNDRSYQEWVTKMSDKISGEPK